MLGLGTNIPDAAGLPTMDADGKIPKDLGKKYGKMILDADGFAQVSSRGLLGGLGWVRGPSMQLAAGWRDLQSFSSHASWCCASALSQSCQSLVLVVWLDVDGRAVIREGLT